MSFEPVDEPTVSFTPVWDPVWDDDAPPPKPALRPPPMPEPDPPLSALVPLSARHHTESPKEVDAPDGRRHGKGRGRAGRVLARFRALLGLIVVVVVSGVMLAAAIGLTTLALGLALRQVAGS